MWTWTAETPIGRRDQLVEELVERVLGSVHGRRRFAQRLEHAGNVGGGNREFRLHDRRPLLEAVLVDLAQDLDVHQSVADLHGVAFAADQVDLVALLDALGRQGGERALPRTEIQRRRCAIPSAG